MNNREAALKIPYGTRDFLPAEAADKRRVESAIAAAFAAWGYDEVVTPTIEYIDNLTKGSEVVLEPHMFKLFDRDNRTLALRHEMTTPIARLAASRFKEAGLPLRLSYVSDVFRYEPAQTGRQCEFFQAGVELMGSDNAAADAEIIALAVKAIEAAGLDDFTVCLGQVDYVRAVLRELGLDDEGRRLVEQAMEKHDLVGLEKLARRLNLSKSAAEIIRELPVLHGGSELLARAEALTDSEDAQAAVYNLRSIRALLADYGVADRVVFDLGVIRDFGYYTGMVFEAYAPGLGFPLAGGGRYDNLLAEFGRPCPATGFALGIDRLMLAKERQGQGAVWVARDVYVAYGPGKISEAIRRTMELRAAGKTVLTALSSETRAQAEAEAKSQQAAELIYIG